LKKKDNLYSISNDKNSRYLVINIKLCTNFDMKKPKFPHLPEELKC